MIVDEREHGQILESIHLPTLLASSDVDTGTSLRWWHKAVLYEVFLRSFADANDDGEGESTRYGFRLGTSHRCVTAATT